MNNQSLPPGFIPVQEAVDLINAYDGSQGENVVALDINGMIQRHRYIQPAHNFRIRQYTIGPSKKFPGRTARHYLDSKWVSVQDAYEAELLKRALANKFRELAGYEFKMDVLRSVTTEMDPDSNAMARPMPNQNPVASVGDVINSAQQVVTGER